MKRRIGILTSGGDCPGHHAAIRGVARASYEMFDAEIVGIMDGYRGLIEGEWQEMKRSQFSGILTLGGTILGTSRQPFRNMRVIGEDQVDKVAAMKKNFAAMKLDCLVTLGVILFDYQQLLHFDFFIGGKPAAAIDAFPAAADGVSIVRGAGIHHAAIRAIAELAFHWASFLAFCVSQTPL